MKRTRNFLLLLLFFRCGITLLAQTYQTTSNGIRTTVNGIDIELQFYNSSTVRVLKSPQDVVYTKESLSVVEQPQKLKFSQKKNGNLLTLKSSVVEVQLNLKSGEVTFTDVKGKRLLKEKGMPMFIDFNDANMKTYSVYQAFILDPDEFIYGLGQLQEGKMSQRNQTKRLIQANTEDVVTFFQSDKGYGIFWDNYSPTTFNDNLSETSFNSEVGDCVDYYFMYGGNADGVISHMRTLTGQVPMFPLWTYGFWQSKERYKSQDELVNVVKKYRELGVPLDGIIQDWQYWGNNYLWNAMEFLNAEFYNPQKMVDDVHRLNAHIIISIWSSFGPMTKPYKDLDEAGMLFNFKTWPESGSDIWPPRNDYPSGVRVYDAYNPQARDIYWNYLNKNIFSLGMDGWWMDSTDPDHLQQKQEDFDTKTYLGSFRRVRNAYPLMAVGGVYNNQRKETFDKRVFILTRSAFAGQQRYGANTWTGDVVATWDVLRKQISAGLNFSLCGIPHWNSDIGGFFLRKYPRKLEDPDYRELYIRWLQFGTFCPMMRSHGTDVPREIYHFGKKGEPYYDAIEQYINLRYALLPYIYSTSWDVTAKQSSFMRALVMDFANDKNALDIDDQYMFGKSILVSPVTEPMYTKKQIVKKDTIRISDFSIVKSKITYLPKGSDWFDFWTNEKFKGGQTVTRETPLSIIPLYVKAGSIIPIGPKVQYAEEKKWDNLEIRIYSGSNGSFTLYEDEFDNYNYEKGAYSEIPMKWNNASRKLIIGTRKGSYNGMIDNRIFTIVLQDGTKRTINYSGKQVKVQL